MDYVRSGQSAQSFITRAEAAELLSVSNRTINRWVDKGVIKAWKTAGGQSRIYLSSVQEMLRERDEVTDPKSLHSVLVVEDDPDVREVVVLYINSLELPLRVIQAADGFQGLMLAGRESPGLIVTDLSMPGLDGAEMIRSIHDNDVLEKPKIVVITALDNEEIKGLGGLPAEIRILQKPINQSELADVVQCWFFDSDVTN